MKFNPITRFLSICFFSISLLQDINAQEMALEWAIDPSIKKNTELQTHQVLTPFQCLNCFEKLTKDNDYLIPYYTFTIPGDNIDVSNVGLFNVDFEKVSTQILHPYLTENFKIEKVISFDKGQRMININVTPIRKIKNATEYIKSFDIRYDVVGISVPTKNQKNKKDQTYNSVLESGDFHKLSITSDGVHKIDYSFLQANNIDPKSIILSNFKIYGNGGEMLPELIITDRSEDLIENPIFIQDNNNNNSLDQDDFILWFAKSPTTIKYNESNESYLDLRSIDELKNVAI